MKITSFIPVIAAAAVLGPLFFASSCANTTESPSGGDKDTIPPFVVKVSPESGSTCVPLSGTVISITFNEYVTIKTATNILLSPPQKQDPESKIKGKSLVISFKEDLSPNTTYTLSLNNAIADNNEGNMFPGFSYVFSTGESIDSLFITGSVYDFEKLEPVKDATVMLYKSDRDSAVVEGHPDAIVKTDDWGYFVLPFLADTAYRLYALKEEVSDNKFDPDNDQIAFIDSAVIPKYKVVDSLPELQKYEMKDTLACKARRSEYSLTLFKEQSDRQYIKESTRSSQRSGKIFFAADNVWIDSLWIAGYNPDQVITTFNRKRDELLFWINDGRNTPDTLHMFISYRRTDSLGVLKPYLEHLKLLELDKEGKAILRSRKKVKASDLTKADTTCVFKLEVVPETVESKGGSITFNEPIVYEKFDSIIFKITNPRRQESFGQIEVKRDPDDILKYNITFGETLMPGYDYELKVPHHAFRDIRGFLSDSTETKFTLPKDEKLSTLDLVISNTRGRRYIIEILDEKKADTGRRFEIEEDCTLHIPYLKKGVYNVRMTEDKNKNGILDPGSLFRHIQAEKVIFFEIEEGKQGIDVPESAEIEQSIDLTTLFGE